MRDETITVRARDIVRVLRSYLRREVGVADLIDWTTVVFYGVHPLMIRRGEWGHADEFPVLYKGVSDADGIKRIYVQHEDKCDDVISSVLSELEDLGDARKEVTVEEIETWIRDLAKCDPS